MNDWNGDIEQSVWRQRIHKKNHTKTLQLHFQLELPGLWIAHVKLVEPNKMRYSSFRMRRHIMLQRLTASLAPPNALYCGAANFRTSLTLMGTANKADHNVHSPISWLVNNDKIGNRHRSWSYYGSYDVCNWRASVSQYTHINPPNKVQYFVAKSQWVLDLPCF